MLLVEIKAGEERKKAATAEWAGLAGVARLAILAPAAGGGDSSPVRAAQTAAATEALPVGERGPERRASV